MRCTSRGFSHKSPLGSPVSGEESTQAWPVKGRFGICDRWGVTAIELMPVHHHVDERFLTERGLTNYWGYNTLSYFAPELRFATDRDPQKTVNEFKRMVRQLHRNGFEVILDVVYNHTCEGQSPRPDGCRSRDSTIPLITGSRIHRGTTRTTPAAATP